MEPWLLDCAVSFFCFMLALVLTMIRRSPCRDASYMSNSLHGLCLPDGCPPTELSSYDAYVVSTHDCISVISSPCKDQGMWSEEKEKGELQHLSLSSRLRCFSELSNRLLSCLSLPFYFASFIALFFLSFYLSSLIFIYVVNITKSIQHWIRCDNWNIWIGPESISLCCIRELLQVWCYGGDTCTKNNTLHPRTEKAWRACICRGGGELCSPLLCYVDRSNSAQSW